MAKAKKHKKRKAKMRAARKRSRRKAQSRARKQANGNGNGVHCRLPLEECRVNGNWRETGFAVVYLNRLDKYGGLAGASYLIDVWGIGIKDCFRTQDLPAAKMEDSSRLPEILGGSLQECSEDLARQLVWGGWWRAREMGFRPPSEFSSCKKLLAPLEQDEVDQSLFGKDGKPLIMGDWEDLQRRSTRPLDLESDEFEYMLGVDPLEEFEGVEKDPWEQLFEEDDHPLIGPGKERVLFIKGTLYGQTFAAFYEALSQWDDLHVEELDLEDETARLVWTRKYPRNHWNPLSALPGARQALGELEIDQSSLTINVRGKSWMLIMMERLFQEFGESLVRGLLEIKDPVDLFDEDAPEPEQVAQSA